MKVKHLAPTATPKFQNIAREIGKGTPKKKTAGKKITRTKGGMMSKMAGKVPVFKPFMQ